MSNRNPYSGPGIVRRPRQLTIATAAELMQTADSICQIVAEDYDTDPELLKKQTRHRESAVKSEPRQIAIWLLHFACGYGPKSIADALGGFNHATVNYSLEVVKNKCETEPDYKERVKRLLKTLQIQHPELLIVGKPII